jgi:hypothetical protein
MQQPSDSSASIPETRPCSAEPAHLGWRLLAMVYDLFPVLALWFATSAIVYLVRGQVPVRPGTFAAWGLLALLWAVAGAYLVFSWRRGGATIGMRPWRLKVLGMDGRPATLRALCMWWRRCRCWWSDWDSSGHCSTTIVAAGTTLQRGRGLCGWIGLVDQILGSRQVCQIMYDYVGQELPAAMRTERY